MHFFLLRRYRRRLLFPPGLLALAGLLWLGCVVVGANAERLKRWYVLQLTMPIPQPSGTGPSIKFFLSNPDTVCRTCAWKETYLTGIGDSTEKQEITRVENTVHAMMNDVGNGSGVRIHFAQTVRFKHLIFVLNTLERENVKKYWLDIYHFPTTLYAFNEPPASIPSEFECLLCADVMPYVPPTPEPPASAAVRFVRVFMDFWQFEWLQPLRQPEWRMSIWLLAAILALSSRRLLRLWLVR